VTPGYIEAAGAPLLRGRTFSEHDGDNKYVLISQSMAKTFFPSEDPIGKRIRFDSYAANADIPRFEIVGIVGDMLTSLAEGPQPTLYRPIRRQTYGGQVYAVVHTSAEPHSLIGAVRAEVGRLDADVAIDQIRTMDEIVGESTADRRFHLLLFGGFAALAMLLAAAGLYGVLSYGVSRRRGEIGLRMALGASGSDVRRLVLRDGLRPALLGIAGGLPTAAAGCQLLKSLLFGIAPIDPMTFAAVPLLLLGVSALASYVPALRAARVDPTVTLRAE
jgi:putative ABC transport system permease protein